MPLDLFSKTPLPTVLPNALQKVIAELNTLPNKEAYVKSAYTILSEKYHGQRIKTYTKFFDVFTHDVTTLWNTTGFLHCTNINYLLRIVLVNSNFFTENDVRLKWTQIWYLSPHQYVQVKLNDRWINIDIWAQMYGIPFGDYAHGFN